MSEPFKMTPEEWLEVTCPGGYYPRGGVLERISFPWDQIIAYRRCKDGEYWVNPYTCGRSGPNLRGDLETCQKVFILRPRKKITVTDYVFKATGKQHKAGEWIAGGTGGFVHMPYAMAALRGYTREEISREIQVDE